MSVLLAACSTDPRQDSAEPRLAPPTPLKAEAEALQRARHAALPVAGTARHPVQLEPVSAETYAQFDDNGVRLTTRDPVSTFSVDVDTGSYANVRRWLNQGRLPPEDAVRVEEMINYFDYAYARPGNREQPFEVTTTLSRAPWNEDAHLLRIAIQGYDIDAQERPPANLVFLVDVSGSMEDATKLPLLKRGLSMLARRMNENDRISLVVYAGASGIVLEPTPGNRKAEIRAAIEALAPGGMTNGASGIRLAYELARQAFIDGGINRVILATDGDFNVGTVNFEELVDLVERGRESGVALTTLGFGSGNYNDQLMEQLADKGNGNHAYIDTLNEARKVLVEEMSSTLLTIAADVKAQIEFNPAVVAEYRLIGYENRMLRREDFNNDKVDAGEIGAGHNVTVLYEIALTDSSARRVDALRYRADAAPTGSHDELAWLKLRYKLPGESASRLVEQAIDRNTELALANTDDDFRFAAAVAAFGQKLRGGKFLQSFDYDDIRVLAAAARGADIHGYRGEFVRLAGLAESLQP